MTGTLALGNENLMTGIIFFMFMVAWGMCRDCRNKTMFLDITSGHSRNKVFFGRLIPAAVIGIIGLIIIYCPCIIYFTAVNGWGSDVKAWHVLIRIFIFCEVSGTLTEWSIVQVCKTSVRGFKSHRYLQKFFFWRIFFILIIFSLK